MARIRTIKPEFFTSGTLAEVSIATERSFAGLLTQADDKGRMRDQPAVLNGALWPERPEHTIDDMRHDLDELVRIGLLCRYADEEGRAVMHLPTFKKHQVINKPSNPRVACPCPVHEPTEHAAYIATLHPTIPGLAAQQAATSTSTSQAGA